MRQKFAGFGVGVIVGALLGAFVASGVATHVHAQATARAAAVSVLLVNVPSDTPGWAAPASLNTLSILTFEDPARGTVCYMVNPNTLSCARR